MEDRVYCASSYLAFRFVEDESKSFYRGGYSKHFVPLPEEERIPVKTAEDIDREIGRQLAALRGKRKGLLLSGGMDSAILASYLRGSDAYTFRFLGGDFQAGELKRAERYAEVYGLRLHYVEISWETVETYLLPVMRAKHAPVHSIEPQLLQAALQAKADGVEMLLVGESSDLVFGGMDGLLAKDWTFEEFVERYTFLSPEAVLTEPASMRPVYERYRRGQGIDFMKFMEEVFDVESSGSYENAFAVAGLPYFDPYAGLRMAEPLNLDRVRHGEPKYLIRELFALKYPGLPIPDKVPMPRPVDFYFKDWEGPKRPEFKQSLDMGKFTGNQKWQLYCLEKFLDSID